MRLSILTRHDQTVRNLFRLWEMFLFPEREIAMTNGCNVTETLETYNNKERKD